ncbi:MAG: cell division protein ZapA, partial [Alphaproteobacteria bacterium HGW-Alphaproteobacteria-11]
MGQVKVSLNDRTYTVACGDGEEDHVRELAAYMNKHMTALAQEVGQVGDARLLL